MSALKTFLQRNHNEVQSLPPMWKDCLLLLLGLSFAVAFTACGNDTFTAVSPSLPIQGIQVTGSGSAFGEPDVVVLSLGVSTERDSVKDAREEAASAMQKVLDSLKSNGVAEKDIQTQQFSIQPQYDFIDQRQVLRGYRVTNIVSAKIRTLDQIGKVIDDAAEAGGDIVQVQSIQFMIDDPKELQAQARVEAMKDAKAKAQILAEEGGVKLGKPISISESISSSPPLPVASDSARSATPIEPGQLEVKVMVSVVYEIE